MDHLKKNKEFQNEGVILHGTLTKPESTGPFPVVIAAPTSSAGTRDFGVYQLLTKILPPCGAAVFLYDRRGSGESTGDFETASFPDLAADLKAAIDHLKLRSDINRNLIGLWGMSSGRLDCPLAAAESADVAFVVAVSAVGVSPAEQMSYSAEYELRENGFSEKAISRMLELRDLVDDYCRGNIDRPEVQEELDLCSDEPWLPLAYLDGPLPEDPTLTKWYQEMDYDPIPSIKKMNVPVLLLYGERDPWVPILKSISRWKKYGPNDLTIHQIRDANHFMISIAQAGIHGDEGPLVEQYSIILTGWLKQRLI